MKWCFVLPVHSQVRYRKRVKEIQKLGQNVHSLAFIRDYYSGDDDGFKYTTLGQISHRKYFKRIFVLIKAVMLAGKNLRQSDVIYAFGLDMLILVLLAKVLYRFDAKIVYEVGDIREVLLKQNFFSACLRWLEKVAISRSALVVVTSEAFVKHYYSKIQKINIKKFLVIENKVANCSVCHEKSEKINDGVIKIGYFGLLRCGRSWEILKKVASGGNGKFKIVIRGYPFLSFDLEDDSKKYPYVEFYGPYKSPSELPMIYEDVDIVWACYPFGESVPGNWQWARTNRFYEACCFGKPMILQKDTEDCRVANELSVGVEVDLADIEGSVRTLLLINSKKINELSAAIKAIPTNIYCYTNEHEKILKYVS